VEIVFSSDTASSTFRLRPGKTQKIPQVRHSNILVIIPDDWSRPHAGVYEDAAVLTPAFDRVARDGVLFQQAFVSAPSCPPSRAALLTGQFH
jgi:arylsulfatase A-like enzyme